MEVLWICLGVFAFCLFMAILGNLQQKKEEFESLKKIEIGSTIDALSCKKLFPLIVQINEQTKIYVFTLTRWVGMFFGGTSVKSIAFTVNQEIIEYISK